MGDMPAEVYFTIAGVLMVIGIVWAIVKRRRENGTTADAAAPPAAESSPAPKGQSATAAVTDQSAPDKAVEVAQADSVEQPEQLPSRLSRLRARLAGSSSSLGKVLLTVLSREQLAEADWEELEDALIVADVGADAAARILDALRTELRVAGAAPTAKAEALRNQVVQALACAASRDLLTSGAAGLPGIVLVVGVNGSGKTTTIGRLARLLVAEGKTVLLGAADTFRAAAGEQLETWGKRVGVTVVRGEPGADPASVAFEAVKQGIAEKVDTVIIDTAGRLQNKTNLMEELGKIARVAGREAPITETLLVLDATTGQNGLAQGRVFAEVTPVSGIVLTKLDGSAKGGIVIAVQDQLGVPVKLVGLGEGPDDLAPFDPVTFAEGLVG